MGILDVMSDESLTLDRGAFFGSIFGTINHLLWGDMLWLNRFDPSTPEPQGLPVDSVRSYPTYAAWAEERVRTDARIISWAEGVKPLELERDLTMFSRVLQAEACEPMGMCIPHFFNHQTHHRGQVHAMLTAAGHEAPVSDLFFMPKDK